MTTKTYITSADLKNHPMYSDSDYMYLRNKGYTYREILKIWNRDAARGCTPVNHKPAPDIMRIFRHPNDPALRSK